MYHDKRHCYLVTFTIVYHVYWCETTSPNHRISLISQFKKKII